MSSANIAKFVIVPGSGSTTDVLHRNTWYSWLMEELRGANFECRLENMPDPFIARESIWLPFMEEELGCDENTIIIGHSAGAQAAMRYAEAHKVLGIVVMAASVTDLGRPNDTLSEYYNRPWQWDKIRSNAKSIVQLGSRDDPVVPFKEQEQVADGLASKFLDYNDEGHLGRTPFPELLEVALNMVNETSDESCIS